MVKPTIFISYSRKDKTWKGLLVSHLGALKDSLEIWDDGLIASGDDWLEKILAALDRATIAILLISADFLNSDFIKNVEVPSFLQRRQTEGIRIIPIIARPCDWQSIEWLKSMQSPNSDHPLSDIKMSEAETILADLAREIQNSVTQILDAIAPVLSNLPMQNIYFTGLENGREDFLKELHDGFRSDGPARAQAICGLGGIGKSQLAIEYAYRHFNEYKAVFWVHAESKAAITSDFAHLAKLLNRPGMQADDQSWVVTSVKQWLEANEGWLLILDNASDPELITGFLPKHHKGHILITSRTAEFGSIGVAEPLMLEKMTPEEAIHFLVKRLGRRKKLSARDSSAASRIAEMLDYLPLALEQAGAYITRVKCSFQKYLDGYRRLGLLLLEKLGPATGYSESVRTTWSLNFQQVEKASPVSADLLKVSSFLAPDKIPLTLIERGAEVIGAGLTEALDRSGPLSIDEALAPLMDYSLIRRDPGSPFYSIHRLVQEVVKDRMTDLERKQLAERTVRAVSRAFPGIDYAQWELCEQLAPHAQACLLLIEESDFCFREAEVLLRQSGNYLLERGRTAEAEDRLKRARAIAERLGSDYPMLGNTLNDLGILYRQKGDYGTAADLHNRAMDIQKKKLGSTHSEVADSLNNLARVYSLQGGFDKALPLYEKALRIYKKELGESHPRVATSLNLLARLHHACARYDQASSQYSKALDIQNQALDKHHPDCALTLHNMAMLFHDQAKYVHARSLYERSLAIRVLAFDFAHPHVASTLHNLAWLFHDQGAYGPARSLYERALDIRENALGPGHPHVATSMDFFGRLCHERRKFAQAASLYEKALKIRRKVLGPKHPDLANSLYNLGWLLYDQGKCKEAKPLYEDALAIRQEALGKDHPQVAAVLNNLATLHHALKQFKEAAALCEDALEIREKALGPNHPYLATSLNNLAWLLYEQGNLDRSIDLGKRALEIREKAYGPEHPFVDESLYVLAVFLRDRGEDSEALPLFLRVLALRETRFEENHPKIAAVLKNCSFLLRRMDRIVEAERVEARLKSIRAFPTTRREGREIV